VANGQIGSRSGAEESLWLTLDLSSLSDHYGPALDEVVRILVARDVPAELRYSVRDIVLEYLLNWTLHSAPPPTVANLELGMNDAHIYIRLCGEAQHPHVRRMQRTLSELSDKSSDQLWEEHAARFRNFGDKPSDAAGAGLGLLLVAALSSKPPDLTMAPGEPRSWYELSARVFIGKC